MTDHSIEALIEQRCTLARIESLGNVVLDYGHRQAMIWINGKSIGLLEHLDNLKAELSARKDNVL